MTLVIEASTGTDTLVELKTPAMKDLLKDVAIARILAALVQQALVGKNPLVVRDQRALRTKLNLEDIDIALFKRSLWHLDQGDRHHARKRLIRVSRHSLDGRRKELSVRVMDLPIRPKISPQS